MPQAMENGFIHGTIANRHFGDFAMTHRTKGNAHNFQDFTGQRFGRLVCLSYGKVRSGTVTKVAWLCRCDCGTEVTVRAGELRTGDTKSCGCLRREMTGAARRTHGRSETAEYEVWLQMIQRCTNEKNVSFKRYGGRGIYVCKRWRNSFEAFIGDMGPRPSKSHSIERKDNDGPYAPSNCVWATKATQNRNSRNVVLTPKMVADVRAVRARGQSVRAWAARHRISYKTARRAADGESWKGCG